MANPREQATAGAQCNKPPAQLKGAHAALPVSAALSLSGCSTYRQGTLRAHGGARLASTAISAPSPVVFMNNAGQDYQRSL